MSPLFDPERTQINAARQSRDAIEKQILDSQSQARDLEAQRASRLRAGATPDELAALDRQIQSLQQARAGLYNQVGQLNTQIEGVIAGVLVGRSPEQLFGGLDGSVPVALLPVRLETRYFQTAQGTKLRLRIYPDQVHLDAHIPELLPAEVDLGKWYWGIRWTGDETQTEQAWTEIAKRLKPTRAAWVIQSLTPTNPPGTGDSPLFPTPPLRASGVERSPQATLLPDRWCAVGLRRQKSGYQAVFKNGRVWGSALPDSLNVSLSYDELSQIPDDPTQLPMDAGMRWLADYDEALKVGMAITITDQDMVQGARLQDGLDLLVVLGVDWTLTPTQGAEALARMLHAHQFSDGLGFIPQGTPTNNTGEARSGLSSDPVTQAAGLNPAQPPQVDPAHSASGRMSHGLGLPEGLVSLDLAPQAGLREARLTSRLVDALWESTFGYYLKTLLDPLLSDSAVDLIRDHAAKYLQPFGPFSAFRIHKQPYGLVPALSRSAYKPDHAGGLEDKLNRVLSVLLWYWQDGLGQLIQMGSHANPDDDLLPLLRRSPIAATAQTRLVVDGEFYANLVKKGFSAVQSDILRSLVLPQMASVAGPFFPQTKIASLITSPVERKLSAPWVQPGQIQPGDPLQPNYIQTISNNTQAGSQGRVDLNTSTNSSNLLEAFLALAALKEMDYAGHKLVNTHLVKSGLLEAVPDRSTLPSRSLVGFFSSQVFPDQPQAVKIETSQQLASLVIPELTHDKNLADFVSASIRLPGASDQPDLRNLATFRDSLDELAGFSALELERAFRAVLDCYAYRLDAWATSQATRRLIAIRGLHPVGLHVGGYGWVENLRPDTRPDSLGYIHTPSLSHAVTAAVLRAGYINNRGTEDINSPLDPLDPRAALSIDLSSERVRLAMTLLEGVSQGQPLAALLGYRLERNLRERDILLTQFIMPLRKLAPFRPTVPDPNSGPTESIGARDVIDGVSLLTQWRTGPDQVLNGITDPAPDATQREELRQEIDRLAGMFDAVSDLLVSESVYQMVNGNYERAGAALSALDRQTRPPEPEVIRTPRTGMLYQQRVALIHPAADLPPAWVDFPSDPRAQAEPRLNAWIAGRMGDPGRVRLSARLLRTEKDGEIVTESVVQELEVSLDELGLSPLSLVLTCISTSPQALSDLELRLVQVFAEKATDPTPDLKLELLDNPPAGAPEDAIGYGKFRALLQLLHGLITRHRGADARDFAPPEQAGSPNCDLDELRSRLERGKISLNLATSGLEAAIQTAAADGLRAALLQAFQAGALGAIPTELQADAEAVKILVGQAQSVLAGLKSTQKRLADLENGFAPAETGTALETARLRHLLACFRLIFGESFPVMPLFRLVNPVEFNASKTDQVSLLGGDSFAPLTWLQQMATVRSDTDALVSVLTASEMLGAAVSPEEYSVAQFPHVPGQRWAALDLPGKEADPHLAIAIYGQFDPNAPLAGLYIDGWSEVIPSPVETTGMTFHYDVPAARPPQAVLLAVPPDLSDLNWSIDRLLDTVLDTLELAKIRLVGPREIPVLGGGLLPALYLPGDQSKQDPSVDVRQWLIKDRYIQGKEYRLGSQ